MVTSSTDMPLPTNRRLTEVVLLRSETGLGAIPKTPTEQLHPIKARTPTTRSCATAISSCAAGSVTTGSTMAALRKPTQMYLNCGQVGALRYTPMRTSPPALGRLTCNQYSDEIVSKAYLLTYSCCALAPLLHVVFTSPLVSRHDAGRL